MGWGIVVLVVACGCGPERVEVTGDVTYAGRPLPDGAIRLFPLDRTASRGAATAVSDGGYRIPPDAGLVRGKYRVEITAVRPTGREVARIDIKPGEPTTMRESKQYLPARYNLESILEVELGDSVNHCSFALEETAP
jgi:hypothetical protein